jgi:hypothetical protein
MISPFWGAIQWRSLLFEEPIFQLQRDKSGRFNFIDEPSEEEQPGLAQQKILQGLTTLFGGSVILQGGRVSFVDEGIAEGPLTTIVEDFNLSLEERLPIGRSISGSAGRSAARIKQVHSPWKEPWRIFPKTWIFPKEA